MLTIPTIKLCDVNHSGSELTYNGYFFFLKTLTSAVSNGLIAAVAQIAQSVEQGIENPRVGGSIPSLGTIC